MIKYILMYNMEAFFMQEYSYFQRICEMIHLIVWHKGGLKKT